MAYKPKSTETKKKPAGLKEQGIHEGVREVRQKIGSIPLKRTSGVENPDFDEDAMIRRETERLSELDTAPEDINSESPLPEISSSPERLLSIESASDRPFPAEITKIIGGHGTFWKAMEDERSFSSFLKALPKLKREIDSALLSEMLQICAEQSYEITSFIQDDRYTGKPFSSWEEAVTNPMAFADFMCGWWITQIFRHVKPKEAITELLIVAARTSKENAQLILDKVKRDAEGGPMKEDPPYHLRILLGNKAFDRLTRVAHATIALEK